MASAPAASTPRRDGHERQHIRTLESPRIGGTTGRREGSWAHRPDVSALALIDDCPLTDREIDVPRATADGYSAVDVAGHLHLAEGTVRNHLSSAMRKTQTQTQTQTRHEAARYAREHDWL